MRRRILEPGDHPLWIALVIVLTLVAMCVEARASMECEARGGTYLHRERKCISARTIPTE